MDYADICLGFCGGSATRPLLRDGGVEELHRDPTVGFHAPRSGLEVKNGSSGVKMVIDVIIERNQFVFLRISW